MGFSSFGEFWDYVLVLFHFAPLMRLVTGESDVVSSYDQ